MFVCLFIRGLFNCYVRRIPEALRTEVKEVCKRACQGSTEQRKVRITDFGADVNLNLGNIVTCRHTYNTETQLVKINISSATGKCASERRKRRRFMKK
jgi:hypothetical protein